MKISIITATWNSETTLRDTIESVLSQSHQDFEHIIIDGKSSDKTVQIINEYEKQYNGRLKWICEKDNGIYDAMNKGLKMATGDVIGILNSDDFYFDTSSLKRVNDALSDKSVDAVYSDNVIVNWNNTDKVVRRHINSDFRPWQMRFGFMPSHPTFYCRKEIYDKLGGFDDSYKIAADFDWLLRAIFINKISIKYNPGYFTKMRAGGASQSGFKTHKTVITEHLKAYHKYGIKSNIVFELSRMGYKYFCKLFHLSY